MNKHIEENLNHYITLTEPEYAVLLSGKWGSGKTYFIDKFVDDFLEKYKRGKEENKIKFIQVSLFGLRDTSSIDEDIFQQLHSILGHKYTKFVGNLAKSAIKFGLKFDYNGDNKSDGTVGVNLNSFNPLTLFGDSKESPKELIFIFDDLERTNIELSEVLGYINYLVEQSGFKVIILANEKEIKEKEKYETFKEKIIGKTLEVKQDLDATFETFIDMVDNSKVLLQKNKELIKNIFKTAGYNNLRHIRQTILDFEYFYNQLDEKFQRHNEIMKQLINEFFIFSIEIKSGSLNSENFEIFDYYLDMLTEKSEDEETPLKVVFKRHSLQNEYNILLNIEIWKEILLEGYIKDKVIDEALNNSKYFMNEKTESWRRLWNYHDLEDDEFKSYIEDILEKFNKNEYKEQGKLLHVIALLLYFSKSKMIKDNQKNIMKEGKKNIIDRIKSEKWDKIEYDIDFGGSAYGLGFYAKESQSMQNILDYFKKEIEKSFNVQLKEKANELLEGFKNNNLEKLEKKLQQEFYEVPILSKINIDDFVSMLRGLEHKNISDIVQQIKKRYSNTYNLEQILSEEKFWKSVNSRILKNIDINDNPVKYNLLKSFKEYAIKEILQSFDIYKKNLKIGKAQDN